MAGSMLARDVSDVFCWAIDGWKGGACGVLLMVDMLFVKKMWGAGRPVVADGVSTIFAIQMRFNMKKTLTQKQIAEYEKFCHDRDNGRLLTPEGLRMICSAYKYDPEAIGRHFLELLAKMNI